MIDGSRLIQNYIDVMDSNVDDLGYDIDGILRNYSSYKYDPNRPSDIEHLANLFHTGEIASELSDARALADEAVKILYPAITRQLQGLGYLMGIIHQTKIGYARNSRNASCEILLMVA